jgi:hypothetical protein
MCGSDCPQLGSPRLRRTAGRTTKFERRPILTSTPPVYNAVVPGVYPVPAALGGKWLNPVKPLRYQRAFTESDVWAIYAGVYSK